ncbi:MAG: MarR family transcriptional regulator [Spirochaetes bacterium]|jgi:DNA-binding MarR family transcriptional regulator|nr:MarR family transcriptional regulator [Spirochaetota bacterium]
MNKDHILFEIGRIHYRVNKFLGVELEKHGITGIAPSHGEIIGSLLMRGPLTMKEIAGIVGKDKSTVTSLVSKLIDRGYVKKSENADDKRITIISLTRAGKALKPHYEEISSKLKSWAYSGFSEEERDRLHAYLIRLGKNL